MPNGALDYSKFTIGPRKAVDMDRLKMIKSNLTAHLSTTCSKDFMQVNSQKTLMRTQIKKLWI
jgi:hypothetical protein